MRKKVLLLMLSILMSVQATAATVAYWRFEEGPAGAQVPKVNGGPGYEESTMDSSGHSYDLSVWDTGGAGYVYRTEVSESPIPQTGAVNNFSVKNSGGGPAMWTNPAEDISKITPAAWTIEISIKPENGGYRTYVGRDSKGTVAEFDQQGLHQNQHAELSGLYLQAITNGEGLTNALAIKFCDVSGIWHQAVSGNDVFQGYNWGSDPDGNLATWYNIAAVSDGTYLSLYLRDVAAGTGYQLIAQTHISLRSTNTALTAGLGGAGDWTAGEWTVGRGLFAGGHGDRGYGYIDEVRISDTALGISDFLFYSTPTAGVVITPSDLILHEEGSTGGDIFFSLEYVPSAEVILTVVEQAGRGQVTLDRTTLTFTTGNWNVPQPVHVTAVDDADLENAEQKILLAVTVSSALDKKYDGLAVEPVVVTVLDNECGAWGYAVADLNQDCRVNLLDLVIFATYWLDCSYPDQINCTDFSGN